MNIFGQVYSGPRPDSKPKVRICMTNSWQLDWRGSFLGYGAQIKRVKAFG